MTPGNGYQTPSKLLKDSVKDGVSSHPPTPLIPVVRSALDIVADLYVLVPEIKSYVHHMVTSGSFLFLKSYIISVDPKTVISAVNFVSDIISDFLTTNDTGNSIAENEKKLDMNDVKEFYNCAVERLQLYCEIRYNSAQCDKSDTCNKVKHSKSADIISNKIMKNNNENECKEEDEMEIEDSEIIDVVSLSDQARNIVLQPLIRSFSILINKCLHAADAMSPVEQRKFYSIEESNSIGVDVSLYEDAKVLLLSMRIAFHSLILVYSEKRENKIMSSEKFGNENNDVNIIPMESRNNYFENDEKKNRNKVNNVSDDKTNKMIIEEKDEIFDGFVSRKRQLILTILSSISLLRSHAILQKVCEMKEVKLQQTQHCQKTSTKPSNHSLKNFDTEIKTFFVFFFEKKIPISLVRKGFLSVLIQGEVDIGEFLSSENEENNSAKSDLSNDRIRLRRVLRLFYQEIENECENEEESEIDNNDISINRNNISNKNDNKNDMKISTSNTDNIKVQTHEVLENSGNKSNNLNNNMSMNVKSDAIRNDYDGQGSDESQNSCLLTLTCLGATSLTSTTDNTRNSTCENIQKCRTNNNSPEKNISSSVKNIEHVINSENESNNGYGNENFGYEKLSTAFTPAHSKNRQIFDNQGDSGILSPSCTNHFTENNEENESFLNSESTIFNIEIEHDDKKNENECGKESKMSHLSDIKCVRSDRSCNIFKSERNLHKKSGNNNNPSEENKKMKKLAISDNVKRFEDDGDTLDLTNMSIEDCSRTMTVAVAVRGARASDTHMPSAILSQSKPLTVIIPAPVSLPSSPPIPLPFSLPPSITSSLPVPASFPVTLPFSSPVPTPPTLAVILTETKASVNALRHTLSYVHTSSTYAPVSIQSIHLDSTATTATSTSSHSSSSCSSSSSSFSASHHPPTHQSVNLNGHTVSTVSEEEDLDGMDCVSRLKNILSASDITATQLEMNSIREENVLLKKLRDSSVVDRMSGQALITALHFESAGTVLKRSSSIFLTRFVFLQKFHCFTFPFHNEILLIHLQETRK